MRKYIAIGLLAVGLAGSRQGQAQTDPHFSQYYVYPLWLNPALTGAIDGDYRVTAIYRNQWGNIAQPFSTPGISADVTTGKNVNLGVNIMNQTTGGGGYNHLTAYASMSYTGVRFGREGNHRIAMGMSFGVINRRFDPSKFQTGEMWQGAGGFNPTLGSGEMMAKTSAMSFDAGAGIVYFDATPGKKANIFAGFSAFHITQPEDPFITGGENQKMPIRYTAHGGVKLNISETFSLTPHVLYMQQDKSQEKMVGAYGQLKVNDMTDFLVGANYRIKDAISPYIGFYYKNFVLGASYDINTSDLGKIAGNANSFEISLSFMGRSSKKQDAVPFVCPRL